MGSDRCILDIIYLASTHFYPRSPRGERLGTRKPYHVRRNFYPRSPRGERPNKCKIDQQCCSISIHAPRVGSDCWYIAGFSAYRNFYPRSPRGERLNEDRYGQQFWRISIHAPRVGSDVRIGWIAVDPFDFYPRSPRGERQRGQSASIRGSYFYPRSPRGERLSVSAGSQLIPLISIHAPRVGSDVAPPYKYNDKSKFLSTLPAWGATRH